MYIVSLLQLETNRYSVIKSGVFTQENPSWVWKYDWLIMQLCNSDDVIYMFCNNWIYFYDALWLSKSNVCGMSSQTVVFKKKKT